MNKPQPTLQGAVVAGLSILSDPDVRVPANQAEGLVALRTLLQALGSGQLIVTEAPQPVPTPNVDAPAPVVKARAPRRTKAQMAALNGAAGSTPVAAPSTTQ